MPILPAQAQVNKPLQAKPPVTTSPAHLAVQPQAQARPTPNLGANASVKSQGQKKGISTATQKIALARQKQAMAQKISKKPPQLSQRDMYAKAMARAQAMGGSNGIGVGY